MVDAETLGHRPDRGVVAFVQNPDVHLAPVPDLAHRPQGALQDVERLLGGHDRRQHRDPQAARRGLGHGVLHGRREQPDGDVLHEPDGLDADDHAEGHPGDAEPPAAEPDHARPGNVRGKQQPADEHQRGQRVEAGQQGQRGTLARRGDAAETDRWFGGEVELTGDL